MRKTYLLFVAPLLFTAGCITLPKDKALAKTILDTRGAIGEATGAKKALSGIFDGKESMTAEAKAELEKATTEARYASALFYLKAIPLLVGGESQKENATKALQDAKKHASFANEHLTKAEAILKEQVK